MFLLYVCRICVYFYFCFKRNTWTKLILKWSTTSSLLSVKRVAFSCGYFYCVCLPVLFLGTYLAVSHWKIKILLTNKYFNQQRHTHMHACTQSLHLAHPVTEQVIHLYASPRETLGVTYSLLLSFSLSLDSCRGCVMTVMLILSCETEMMTEWKKGEWDCSNKVLSLSVSQPRSVELWGEEWSCGHRCPYFLFGRSSLCDSTWWDQKVGWGFSEGADFICLVFCYSLINQHFGRRLSCAQSNLLKITNHQYEGHETFMHKYSEV